MSRRLSRTTTVILRGVLASRDGEHCQICGATPEQLDSPLEIDHVDNDSSNWTGDNVELLCKACNVGKRNRHVVGKGDKNPVSDRTRNLRAGRLRKRTPNLRAGNSGASPPRTVPTPPPYVSPYEPPKSDVVCVCSFDSVKKPHYQGDHPHIRKGVTSYDRGSSEMQANFLYQADYTTWLFGQLSERGHIPYAEAVDGGAMVTGASVDTIARYLRPLKSPQGPLEDTHDTFGARVLVIRAGVKIRDYIPRPTEGDD